MSKYNVIKTTTDAYIKQNGQRAITGPILNSVLNAIIDSLGRYYQFSGVATPSTTPASPDQNVAYLAATEGTYTNMGGAVLESGEVAILKWDGDWVKETLFVIEGSAVVYDKAQELTDAEKAQARSNIGAGTSSFSGSYDDLTNKPDLSGFITRTVNDLTNYYLKSETYTKAEVEALIAQIQGMEFVPVQTLPTASADTMGKIYLVPAANPQTDNQMDEYYTQDKGAGASTRYTWELFGSAAIDLSGYVTTAALNAALANYVTSADFQTALAGKQDVIADLATIRNGAAAGATAYQKPAAGIPKADLDAEAQTSLGKADTALQEHQYLSAAEIDAIWDEVMNDD